MQVLLRGPDSATPSVNSRLRHHVTYMIGKPCAGKPHARTERGVGKRAENGTVPLTSNGGAKLDTIKLLL